MPGDLSTQKRHHLALGQPSDLQLRLRGMIEIPKPPRGRDSLARRRARQALADVLWRKNGARRLPAERALLAALSNCTGDDAWWVCEASSAGPVYLLPTREWVRSAATFLRRLGVRSIVEVAAGDGFLAARLARALPEVRVIATDHGHWRSAAARMAAADHRNFPGVRFAGIRAQAPVEKLSATAAVRRYRPDLVLVSWAPPGLIVERAICGPCRFVLAIGAEGDVTGNGARTWRYHHELVLGPPATRAICRLDARARHSDLRLYYGRRHPWHGTERASS